MNLPGLFRAAGRGALDLLLPPACLTCDEPVTRQGQFCAACFAATGFVSEPFCRRCAVPFASLAQAGPDRVCPACRERPPAWRRARAALRYDDQARRLVLPLKHADSIEIAAALAGAMARAGAALLRDAELIVPVPLHRRRLRARRYNQAALLAWRLSRLAGVPACLDAAVRLRPTAPLGVQGAAARRIALAGAFAARPARLARIAGRRLLLVDDVLTSGATADHCAEALLDAGAASVDLLVAARVPNPGLDG